MQVCSYPEEVRPRPLSLLQMFILGPFILRAVCFCQTYSKSRPGKRIVVGRHDGSSAVDNMKLV